MGDDRTAADWEAHARRYQAVHDGSPDGLMMFVAVRDAAGAIVDFEWLYSNASASRVVGRAPADLRGRRLLVEMPGTREAGLFALYVAVVETGQPHARELAYRHQDLDHWCRATSLKLDDGMYIAFSDVTERKRSEVQSRFAAIVESSDYAIYSTSNAGAVEVWNDGAARLFGYAADEIVGRSVHCLIPEPHRAERDDTARRVMSSGGTASFVSLHQTKVGATLHVALMVSPIRAPEGGTVGLAVIARDVSADVAMQPRAPSPTAARRATVLIIDDEVAVGVTLARMLREHDVTVLTRARDALALIATGRRFDVILSDLMMPEMTGMDFHDELERDHPGVAQCVVFMSGGATTPAAQAFLQRVPNNRMMKPFDVAGVRDLVRDSLARS